MNPAVSPSGDLVVWERCVGSNCDIYGSRRVAGTWSAPAVVAATAANESNPDSDGTTDRLRLRAAERDRSRRLPHGPWPGGRRSRSSCRACSATRPSRAASSASRARTAPETPADLFVYVIATNTVYRVTSTPGVDETLNDVSVPPERRACAWSGRPTTTPCYGLHNVYARTFTVPLTADLRPADARAAGRHHGRRDLARRRERELHRDSATDASTRIPPLAARRASGSVFADRDDDRRVHGDRRRREHRGRLVHGHRARREGAARPPDPERDRRVGLPAPLKAQLIAKLQALLAAFDPGNPAQRGAVCTALTAFGNTVRLLSGVVIPRAQAARWIADASRIRAVLGC